MILSADEVAPLEARLRGCSKNWGLTQAAMRAVIDACFPQPWYRRGRRNPVWRYVEKLPPPGQMKAVWDFIQSLVIALGLAKPSAPGTDGPEVAGQHDGSNTAS